jgi:hypothetical protein
MERNPSKWWSIFIGLNGMVCRKMVLVFHQVMTGERDARRGEENAARAKGNGKEQIGAKEKGTEGRKHDGVRERGRTKKRRAIWRLQIARQRHTSFSEGVQCPASPVSDTNLTFMWSTPFSQTRRS